MSSESKEFEVLISRIYEHLENEDVEVTWDDRIPDPDNPKQKRQIDITVRDKDFLSIIECRLHQKKQDVKWIEELKGRKESLNAHNIVGVSSSGFTEGAIKKANRFGIPLFDVRDLDFATVESWAKPISLKLAFYEYVEFNIYFFFKERDLAGIDIKRLKNDLENFYQLRPFFEPANKILDGKNLLAPENRKNTYNFSVEYSIDELTLSGKAVQRIKVEGNARLQELELLVPGVLAYGNPNEKTTERKTIVQKHDLGKTHIINHDNSISVYLDLSELELKPFWQFRFVEIHSDVEVEHKAFTLIEPSKLTINVDKLNVGIGAINV